MELRDPYVVFLIVCFCGSIRGEGDVRKPPSITKHPTARIIYRSDDTVILECEAQGVPAVSYEWMKNGFELNQNRLNIQRGAGGTVTIQHATSMDEGFYQCFARNQYGTAPSITAHIQIAVLDTGAGTHAVLQKIVEEGMPFHIQADTRRSFPKPVYRWEMATDTVDRNPLPLYSSSRVQVAENGDLHFAYALPEDGLDGRIYKCTTYNPYLDVKAGGSYTRLTVTKNTSGVRQFAPALRVSSDDRTVAIIGGAVTLKCFFSGNPIPTVSWSGPSNALPIGRYKLNAFDTELTINSITAADEGDYICTASNTQGHIAHTLQMRVEAVPRFLNSGSGPLDINVTEGQSSTFHCKADAKPEAAIVWFQDGIELHPNNPPNRFVFSSDNKSLTIRNVCRDCVDRESKTDLMVIQCNASNVHGHTFASGYLNVLSKTKVTLISNHNLLVNVNEEYEVQFNCCVSSDPSTFPSIRWFKIGQFGDERVRNDPPFIWIAWGTLTIRINPNNTEDGGKDYLGEYKCVGDNGYSSDFKTAKLIAIKATTQESTQYRTGPSKGNSAPDTTLTEETHLVSDKTEEQSATNVSPVLMPGGLMIQDFWVWIIIATAILVLLLLVFSVCTTIIQCKQKAWNNDTSSKEENDRPTDLPADFIEPDYETIDDDFMKSVQNSQPSLASGSFLKGSKRDVQPRSDTYVSVGGVASSGLPAVKVLRQTVRNESIVMKRGREELSEIPEASESSVQTTEYMALAEREPAIQTEYDVLKEKEELNPVRYMSSKNPERVKRIKSWFV